MDALIRLYIEQLQSSDKNIRNAGYTGLLAAADEVVDWAYECWDLLKNDLTHSDHHRRTIAVQLLSKLAKSDPEKRMMDDFPSLMAVTRDEKFATVRHSLQSLWQIGLAGPEQRELLIEGLCLRYEDCIDEKNYTLIRYDIVHSMRRLYDQVPEPFIRQTALDLIEKESDVKYRRKYAGEWKKAVKGPT
ncbi:hypothetical protein DFQ01_113103 [Paenibacillus cellulosilyticus]|uniref:HEAT repeat protein n=1 Tax=Paenibacillus cellulosilyticus TaxID=375489 RepID=A0A2V2YRC0_9BACL|nr:hypothetical protein [Paenibacillus cellulosilyticus]PWV99729.1 hypothetical protein DFQ01_113103 [Paenibacillus cellulosilyticus]QKS44841.1 hypothetical protein HUB94_10780 [Paenibacillus cellulosilyticus]